MTSHMSIASNPTDIPFIRTINLNEYFSRDNVWTCRLLGLEPFQQHRTVNLIKREYDSDFYGQRLSEFKDNLDALRDKALHGTNEEIVISIKDKLFLAHLRNFLAIKRHYMLLTLDKYAANTQVCELGAGFGSNLLWLQLEQQRVLYGGELCDNAVTLGRLLGLEIRRFNFYEPETYELIRPGSTVYTSHAIEQVSDAQIVVDSLKNFRDRITCVIHFEPLYRENQNDLIGLLRCRYTQINDYNRNLLECLRSCSEIEIVHMETDLFGRNPLNPTSILVWRFK